MLKINVHDEIANVADGLYEKEDGIRETN